VKSRTWDNALVAKHRSFIKEEAGRRAFDAIVAAAIKLPGYLTEPAWQGQVRIFRYADAASGERPFAFIVNPRDLLFSVRAKGLERVPGGFAALRLRFATAMENKRGEWTVRIGTREEADRLNALLFEEESATETHSDRIPDGITREDVLGALARLDAGEPHQFAESVKYDVVHEGRRYAPSAVIGLAAERLVGRKLGPSDFKGGEESKAFRTIRQLRFEIAPKPENAGPTDAQLPEILNHWWVNHKKTFRQEIEGNYLWSPKLGADKRANPTYGNMTRAVPGDIVFSYADGLIKAVGIVTGPATTAQKPGEFGSTGENWDKEGWRLPVAFTALDPPLRPKAHMDTLAPLLPESHSPIRASGDGNQAVHLAAIPAAMAAELRRLLSAQVERIEAKHKSKGIIDEDQHPDAQADRDIFARSDIGPAQKQALVDARRGLGAFRERVIALEGRCRVTRVDIADHLRASHIKPWKDSSDQEKLDGNNGLLLAPHIDHLFNQGYIGFSDAGDVLVSTRCPPELLGAWSIWPQINVGPFRPSQRPYLAYHRAKFGFAG
jgi:HNH endonuclease